MRATKELNVKKQNHGITLIALIITIIVMLILVAVTITMAVNGGLFGQAADAGKKTNEVVALEQALGEGRIKIGDTWYDSPQDYVNKNPSENQEDGEQVTPETPTEPEQPGDDENIQITILGDTNVDVKNTIILTAQSEDASFVASNIVWESSKPEVATVNTNGEVTGVNASIDEGKVTIIAKYNNKEVASKEITVNPVLIDCPLCITINDPSICGYCQECQIQKWNEFTNNAQIIANVNSNGNSKYSNLLSVGQDYVVLPVFEVVKRCLGCDTGDVVTCGYCNGTGQLYDMGIDYKRVAQ